MKDFTRREFIKDAAILTTGTLTFGMLPELANGGRRMANEKNLLIRNTKIFNPDGTVSESDILISGDKISKIGKLGKVEGAEVIDGRGKFAVPGFVNAHTHASMTLLRSYADDKALMDWLTKDIWPIEAKMVREDIYCGAALAAVEMIKSGTTAFADMYGPFMEEVAKVVDESGLRGALCQGIIGIADGDENARLALDMYVDRIDRYIAEYYLELGGKVDAIVFTATIGERSDEIRRTVSQKLNYLGFAIDEQKNLAEMPKRHTDISAEGSKPVWVIRTDESEEMIRRASAILDTDGDGKVSDEEIANA